MTYNYFVVVQEMRPDDSGGGTKAEKEVMELRGK
jgi:hypothetical protein